MLPTIVYFLNLSYHCYFLNLSLKAKTKFANKKIFDPHDMLPC